jgi:hypothetical protein
MGFFENRGKAEGGGGAGLASSPFPDSPLSQVGAEGSQAGFPMSNAEFASPPGGEGTGAFGDNAGSQFLSMMSPDSGAAANARNRKIALVGLVVVSLAAGGYLLTSGEGASPVDSLLALFDDSSTESPPAPDAAVQAPVEATPVAVEEEEVVEEELPEPVESDVAAADESYEYTKVGIEGEYSKEKVWEALKHADDWRNAGEHDSQILSQYLAHPKVWVRLAALEVAVLQKGLSRDELYSAGKDISDGFNRGQIVRFMQRVRFRDINTFNEMMKYLQLLI